MPKAALLKNGQYYRFNNFLDPGLICAFSCRALGNMSLCYGQTQGVLENRKQFLGELGVDYRDLVCAHQVHGNAVCYIQESDKGKGALVYEGSVANTDALVTDKKGLPLAIFTADCLCVFLYDPDKPAIGVVHAGWRSTKDNIVAETIKLMRGEFNTDPKGLYAAFGPAIRSCCFEVEKEIIDFFSGGLIQRDNRSYLDLPGINKNQLLDSGVKGENISDCGICTLCRNADFFSYRKEKSSSGRMMSVMML
ncbi:MAG: peptidoglycan editing factor PgeF [Candidatus Omnitrophota bacterium]